MKHQPDIKWRTETPKDKQYNGMSVIARHLSWYNEGDDQNPSPWAKINTQYFIGSIIDDQIHIEEEENGNNEITQYIIVVADQTTPIQEHHHYSQFMEYHITSHQFFYDDGSKTHQWQWALLEG